MPVTDASGPAEAHIVASMLRESGVEAFVFDTANQTLQWDAPRIINPYLIHVKHEDLDRARQLIKSNREESVDLDWDEVDVGEPVDEIAERIRALGALAPGGLGNLAQMAGVKEIAEDASAEAMVQHLVDVNEKLVSTLAKARDLAGDADDSQTEDLMIARIQVHQKTIWMLKSYLA